jgi:hypothetical protein
VAEARWTMKLSKSDERLRRESPAYRPDDDWEVLGPQAMDVVLSVRFDARTARQIVTVARQTARTPSRLIRDWTLERLAGVGNADESLGAASIQEEASAYVVADPDYESLRHEYRPSVLQILLVGESRPAEGTFFYLANSNLFHATRAAFAAALGPMPSGERFLRYLADRGVWLFDIADQPVDRLPGRPRKAAVSARIGNLVELLNETHPEIVVAIKRNLAPAIRQAMHAAGVHLDRLHVLPFPLYQWRREYVDGLSEIVRGLEDVAGRRNESAAPE